jgi:hypothetical protein
VIDECLDIAHGMPEAGRIAARAGGKPMAARIPSVEIEVGQIQLIDQMRHASAMLVTAVKEQDRATPDAGDRGPAPVEQFQAVVGGEIMVFGGAGHGSGLVERRSGRRECD